MQEKQVFEYAVIRVVPRVEREEFLNAGVVVYCHKLKFLQARFTIDEKRLHAFCSTLNLDEIEEHLRAFERVCKGGTDAGPHRQAGYGNAVPLAYGHAQHRGANVESAPGVLYRPAGNPR
jgi:hypothetical protein